MSSKNIVLGKKSPIFRKKRCPRCHGRPCRRKCRHTQTYAGRCIHMPATPLWTLNFRFVFRFVRFFEPRLRNNAYLCTLKKDLWPIYSTSKGSNKPLIWFPKSASTREAVLNVLGHQARRPQPAKAGESCQPPHGNTQQTQRTPTSGHALAPWPRQILQKSAHPIPPERLTTAGITSFQVRTTQKSKQ